MKISPEKGHKTTQEKRCKTTQKEDTKHTNTQFNQEANLADLMKRHQDRVMIGRILFHFVMMRDGQSKI